MARLAYLFDSSKCVGCHGCQIACKQWNEEKATRTTFTGSYQNPPSLSPDTRTIMRFYENFEQDTIPQLNILKVQCYHCGEPACVKVCPSGALSKTDKGITAVDPSKCIACGYCHSACPFTVPAIGKHVNKCDMCLSRTEHGDDKQKTSTPACVKTCPAGALEFGDRDALVAKAHKRVEWLKTRGHKEANLYGEKVLGGLGVMSVLKYPPASYGLPANPTMPLELFVWKDLFNPMGLLMLVGAVGAAAGHYLLALRQSRDDHHHHGGDDSKGKEEMKG